MSLYAGLEVENFYPSRSINFSFWKNWMATCSGLFNERIYLFQEIFFIFWILKGLWKPIFLKKKSHLIIENILPTCYIFYRNVSFQSKKFKIFIKGFLWSRVFTFAQHSVFFLWLILMYTMHRKIQECSREYNN